jgi:hypothetical protein
MKIEGSCLCSSIKFRVSDMTSNIYQCHCSLCRKQGGSASNSGAVVPLNQLDWIKGEEKITSWVKETGFRSDFCSTCGSPVPNPLKGLGYYWIPVGVLDNAPFDITASLCTASKASWGVVAPTAKDFKTMPDFAELIALLSNNGHF